MGYNRWLKDFFAAWKNLRRIAPAWSRLIGDRGYTDTLDLALALENLGILANAQHQTEKARQAFEEALKIYKAYAKQNPVQFSSDVKRVEKLLQELQR